jgi:DNA-directed RNA polymerase beta subunit
VQVGDLLADGRSSLGGQLAIGKNLLLCYLPWYGLNFEDAIVATERLVTHEIFTSRYIEEIETKLPRNNFEVIAFVPFSITLLTRLKRRKNEFRTTEFLKVKKKLPLIKRKKRIILFNTRVSRRNDTQRKNISRNFIFSKLNTRKEFVRLTKKFSKQSYNNKIAKSSTTNWNHLIALIQTPKKTKSLVSEYQHLDGCGLVKIGTWVDHGKILALRIRTLPPRTLDPYERLLFDVLEKKPPTVQNTSFLAPEAVRGRVINVETSLCNKTRNQLLKSPPHESRPTKNYYLPKKTRQRHND